MKRGEIWRGRIPQSESGAKRRPMLVVSHDAFNENPRYLKVLVVHLTTVDRLGEPFPWEVTLAKGVAGLRRTSYVKCGEIYTLWKEQLEGPAATLSPERMREVDRALAVALGLPRDLREG